jgi:DNA-directed RNA polymerase alpha subunit
MGPNTDGRDLNFSKLTMNALTNSEIKTLGDIISCGFLRLRDVPKLGRKAQNEIALVLFEDYGINLTVYPT